jgi:hypothetical protein
MPMFGLGLTVRHYADLGADRAVVGETLDAAGWDALRVETAGAYSLPPTREALEAKAAEFPDISKRAALVNEALDQRGARTVASYGVGAALIEVLMLQQRPSRALLLSDYGPATVQRLRDLLPDTTVTLHDLLTDRRHTRRASLSSVGQQPVQPSMAACVSALPRSTNPVRVKRRAVCRRSPPSPQQPEGDAITWGGLCRMGPHPARVRRLWRRTHRHRSLRVGDVDGWWLEPRARR